MNYEQTVQAAMFLGLILGSVFFGVITCLVVNALMTAILPKRKPTPTPPADAQDDEWAFDTTDEQP